MNKVVIAGGTGFLGTYLREKLETGGCEVFIISRGENQIQWKDETGIIRALENSDMLINLAGRSVDCRYNNQNRKAIISSRTQSTSTLAQAILKCANPPALWLNASTATIYRDEKDRANTEYDGSLGEGFSVEVAKKWESAFYKEKLPDTRRVALRISIVLGRDGGVIPVYKKLVKARLGGRQGNGKQMFSWIHIEDLYQAILFIAAHHTITGPVNCASPLAVTNNEFMEICRKLMGVKTGIPAPAWLLQMGALLIGTEPELILKSRWVEPRVLKEAGFEFKFQELEDALRNLLNVG